MKEYFYPKKEEKDFFKNYIESHSNLQIKDIICENVCMELLCSTIENKVVLYSLQNNTYDYITDTIKDFMDILHNDKNTNKVFKEYLFLNVFIENFKKNKKIENWDKSSRVLFTDDRNKGYFDENTVKIYSRKRFLEKLHKN